MEIEKNKKFLLNLKNGICFPCEYLGCDDYFLFYNDKNGKFNAQCKEFVMKLSEIDTFEYKKEERTTE
jgi:hypothetical protein